MFVYNFFSVCFKVSTKLYHNTVEANPPPNLLTCQIKLATRSTLVLTSSHPIGHSEIHTLWTLHDILWPSTTPIHRLHDYTIRLRRLKTINFTNAQRYSNRQHHNSVPSCSHVHSITISLPVIDSYKIAYTRFSCLCLLKATRLSVMWTVSGDNQIVLFINTFLYNLQTHWDCQSWDSEIDLKSQCHPKCFARLCFCFETAFCVWLARLPDFSQVIPCKLADMYNSNL